MFSCSSFQIFLAILKDFRKNSSKAYEELYAKNSMETQALNIKYNLYQYMNTTIAVKPHTLELLKKVKEDLKAETFDETILKLIQKEREEALKSLFGAGKGKIKGEFVREEIDRFD